MRNSKGQFVKGESTIKYPIGSVRIRKRTRNGGEQRAYIKIAEPSVWILRARHVWEQAHGPIPRGMGIHHKDRDKLNDDLDNLELVSKSEHIDLHRHEYQEAAVKSWVEKRRTLRWSTKSKTKRTGRPPTYTPERLQSALDAYHRGEGAATTLDGRFGLPRGTILRILKLT